MRKEPRGDKEGINRKWKGTVKEEEGSASGWCGGKTRQPVSGWSSGGPVRVGGRKDLAARRKTT